ncbi:hypothetical protein FACS1894184_13600 [Clostridia bacterium]|nr:hypothetical protein FACS1894184_13600 [Clostridia bacterium]
MGGLVTRGDGEDTNTLTDSQSVPWTCANGVVFADLLLKPAAYEIRNAQSPVSIIPDSQSSYSFIFRSRCMDTDNSAFSIVWTITTNGKLTHEGRMPAPSGKPGSDVLFEAPAATVELIGETFLSMIVYQDIQYDGVDTGCERYRMQRLINAGNPAFLKSLAGVRNYTPVKLSRTPGMLTVTGSEFSISFSESGLIANYIYQSRKQMQEGGSAQFFRAPISIDSGNIRKPIASVLNKWLKAGYDWLKHEPESISVEYQSDDRIVLRVKSANSMDGANTIILNDIYYCIRKDGCIDMFVSVSMREDQPHLPRIS